jgi:hypothetical protein
MKYDNPNSKTVTAYPTGAMAAPDVLIDQDTGKGFVKFTRPSAAPSNRPFNVFVTIGNTAFANFPTPAGQQGPPQQLLVQIPAGQNTATIEIDGLMYGATTYHVGGYANGLFGHQFAGDGSVYVGSRLLVTPGTLNLATGSADTVTVTVVGAAAQKQLNQPGYETHLTVLSDNSQVATSSEFDVVIPHGKTDTILAIQGESAGSTTVNLSNSDGYLHNFVLVKVRPRVNQIGANDYLGSYQVFGSNPTNLNIGVQITTPIWGGKIYSLTCPGQATSSMLPQGWNLASGAGSFTLSTSTNPLPYNLPFTFQLQTTQPFTANESCLTDDSAGTAIGEIILRLQPYLKPVHAVFTPAGTSGCIFASTCTTVYTEDATAGGTPITYQWSVSIPKDPDCALGFLPGDPQANIATWYHADVKEGGRCNHNGNTYDAAGIGHPGVVTVEVSDDYWTCTATFIGTQGPSGQTVADGPTPPQPCKQRF